MTLKHMRILVAVCDCEGVTAAAQKLFLSQPAVSLAVRELEDYYGVPLFERISRKMYITDAGRKAYSYATHIVSLFDSLETEMRDCDHIGTLRIGASMTLGTHYMPRLVNEFREEYPHMKTEILINSSDILEEKILQNELDFSLVEGPIHSDSIFGECLCEDELCIICSKRSPLAQTPLATLEEFSRQPLLLREKNSGTREIVDSSLLLKNLVIHPVWESTSTLALIHAAANDLGVTIVPKQFVDDAPQYQDAICRIKVDGLSFLRKFHIIYHKNKFLTSSAKHFIELCKIQFQSEDID